MKARLVRLRCFVLTALPWESLASSSSGVLCFALHKSSSIKISVFANTTRAERNLPQFAFEGKTDVGKEFMIAEGTVKVCSFHFSRFQVEIS